MTLSKIQSQLHELAAAVKDFQRGLETLAVSQNSAPVEPIPVPAHIARKYPYLPSWLAAYFSEPPLRSLGLAIPFQAEYEGSIPFARRPEVMLAMRRAKSSIANDGLAPTPGRSTAYTRTKIASSVISTVNCPFSIRSPTE